MNRPLAEMFRYNRWADLALIEVCRKLSDDQLDARAEGTSGSIRELLVHTVGAQQTFVLRTQGRQAGGELTRASPWPGFETLLAIAADTSDRLVELAEGLVEDANVDLPYRGKSFRFPKSFFLVHALEHGVERRTEIKTTLNRLGVSEPDLDGWAYSRAAGHGEEVR